MGRLVCVLESEPLVASPINLRRGGTPDGWNKARGSPPRDVDIAALDSFSLKTADGGMPGASMPATGTPDTGAGSDGTVAATMCVFGHGLTMLLLAFRMSLMNGEQMRVARAAGKVGAKKAARDFLVSTYYRSWSRAQLNNAEYAPMLALLCLVIKLRAERKKRPLTTSEAGACVSSLACSLLFIYAACRQGKIGHSIAGIGSAGMSPLRPLGALGRYASQAWLLLEILLRHG